MKRVIDSNCLRENALRVYLQGNRHHLAVLTDYAAMEALKGDPMIGMFESMRVLAEFPEQVQVLETTMVVCGLSGSSNGLQRRLVDVPRTREFALFCQKLKRAKAGATPLVSQLERLGVEARAHMTRMEDDARSFAEASVEVAKLFTDVERRSVIADGESPSLSLQRKVLLHAMNLSASIFETHPAVRRLPTPDELINTYVFRSSLCHMLLGFRYASDGGVASKAAHKIRNDMVDSHFATYATYFDGILTRDKLTNWLYQTNRAWLNRFKPFVCL